MPGRSWNAGAETIRRCGRVGIESQSINRLNGLMTAGGYGQTGNVPTVAILPGIFSISCRTASSLRYNRQSTLLARTDVCQFAPRRSLSIPSRPVLFFGPEIGSSRMSTGLAPLLSVLASAAVEALGRLVRCGHVGVGGDAVPACDLLASLAVLVFKVRPIE